MAGIGKFMQHRTSMGGNFASFVGDWKKTGDHSIIVWLHRKFEIEPLFLHNIPNLSVREDKETKAITKKIYPGNWRCWDEEAIVKTQYNVDANGRREVPPSCPVCKLIDYVRVEVESGRLVDTTPLFKFDGDETSQVLHAGGLFNHWRDVEVGTKEHERIRNAKISLKEAFKENICAKGQYLFLVVDHNNPGKGVQKMREGALLGDKLRGAIADYMEKVGEEKGDPFKFPYAIKFKHLEHEKEFGKKYKAIIWDNVQLTPEIDKLISGPHPSVKQELEYFNAKTMRAYLERHCLVKTIPWDDIFGDLEIRPMPEGQEDPDTSFNPDEFENDGFSVETKTEKPAEDPNWVKCDACDEPMRINWTECPKCKEEYQIDPSDNPISPFDDLKYGPKKEEPKVEEPKRRRLRSEAKAESGTKKTDEKAGF